jgi:hypothetical protein
VHPVEKSDSSFRSLRVWWDIDDCSVIDEVERAAGYQRGSSHHVAAGGPMRTLLLISISVGAIGAVGCGSEGKESPAPSVVRRDLTVPAPPPKVEIASAVELGRIQPARTKQHSARAVRRARPAAPRVTPVVVASQPSPPPAPEAAPVPRFRQPEPVSDRELPPGETVTVIPASSGPTIEEVGAGHGDGWGTGGSGMGGGGSGMGGRGRCPPRGVGPGIGIAQRPPQALYLKPSIIRDQPLR